MIKTPTAQDVQDEIENQLIKAFGHSDFATKGFRLVHSDFVGGEFRCEYEVQLTNPCLDIQFTLPEGLEFKCHDEVGCNHKPKEYVGFTDRYMYCEKCGDRL